MGKTTNTTFGLTTLSQVPSGTLLASIPPSQFLVGGNENWGRGPVVARTREVIRFFTSKPGKYEGDLSDLMFQIFWGLDGLGLDEHTWLLSSLPVLPTLNEEGRIGELFT